MVGSFPHNWSGSRLGVCRLMRAAILSLIAAWMSCSAALAQTPPEPGSPGDMLEQAKAAMMADPQKALALSEEALRLIEAGSPGAPGVPAASALWLQGEALSRLGRPAPAAEILDRGLAMVADLAPGSRLEADLLLARASVFPVLGDYASALETYQKAHDLYRDLGEGRKRAIALQQIANIYRDAREYERALHYHELAAEAFQGDASFELARLNNIANIHKNMGDLTEAEAGFRKALDLARQMKSPLLEARVLTNLASVRILQGLLAEADQTADMGLALSGSGSGHGWEPFLWGVKAQAALARGELSSAASHLEKTFRGVDPSSTPSPFSEFHETAYQVFLRLGDPARAIRHLAARHRLEDEARELAANANLALKGAQFDFATQELQIATLRAEQLEKEIALGRAQERQRAMLLSAAGVIALLVFAGGGWHYLSMRRSRNAIASANDQLRASNLSLEKALKAKSEFLATTSHEIRTPLNGILGMTQVLMSRPALDPDVRERVELLQNAGETMKAIVDDLLDVAKLETGSITLEARPFDLSATLASVGALWKESACAKGIGFRMELDSCPGVILADQQRIRQVVYNLLSNAVKFTDAGEVVLSAAGTQSGGEPGVLIRVCDTGCGIPESEQEAIFEPFHQVDGGTTRRHGGTGLGLSICRTLCAALGGRIAVSSRPGEGSEFSVFLPVALSGAEAPSQPGLAGGGPLFVCANPLHQSLLEGAMGEQTVRMAEDLETGLAALREGGAPAAIAAASALGDDPGAIMTGVMALSEACESMRLVVWIDPAAEGIEPPMMRLAGACCVLEGPFDPVQAAHMLLGEPKQEMGQVGASAA